MTKLRFDLRSDTLTVNTEELLAKMEYARPVLRDMGRMDLVRAKSAGVGDGGGNNKKNV